MLATYTLTQAEVLARGSVQSAYVYTSTKTLADGEWYFQIVAVDSASVNSAVARYHFLVDAGTPVAPAGLYSEPGQNSILVSWDTPYMAYDIASYSLYCDSTTPYDFADQFFVGTSTTTSYLHTGLTNYQPYAYRLTATDRNGHTSDYSGVLNDYAVDGTAPVITSLASSNLPVEDTWYPDPNPIYIWSATDAGGSGLRGYYYILASTPAMTAEEVVSTGTYTAETTVSYAGLADGVWYFYLVAEDNQGNLSLVSRRETRIDYAPGAPRNLNLVPRYRKITLLWDAPSPEPNDFSYYRVYCDSTAPYDFADGFILARSTEPAYAHLNLDAANTYYYRVTTVDAAPNVLESTFSAAVGARPVSSIDINSIVSLTHPSTSAWYTGRLPSFSWSVEGNGGVGVESYFVAVTTYSMSIESMTALGSNITTNTYTAPVSLPDGEWTFSVVSRDLLGDYSALAAYPFKIDASSPPAPTNLVAVSSQNSIALSWNTPIYTYDVDHYLLYCDSVSPYNFADAFLATSTANNFYLHEGLVNYLPYHYRVYAVDKQGNVGNYADTANNAPIDITAPAMGGIVSASHPDQYVWYENSNVTLNWSASDAGGSGINGYYYLLAATETLTVTDLISTGVYTSSAGVMLLNVPDGLWYFNVMALDNQGNMSDIASTTVRVDHFPGPPIDINIITWDSRNNLTWSAPSPDPGDIDYYRVYCDSTSPYDFTDSWIVAQTTMTAFGHNNLLGTNTYYYRLSTVDKGPNALESVYSSVVWGLPLDSIAPELLSLNSPSHPYDTESYQNNIPTFTWTAQDTGGSAIKGYYYKLNQLESFTTSQLLLAGDFTILNTTSYTGTVADGVWYFHAVPVDYQNNVGNSLSRKIIVNMPPAPPTALVMDTDTIHVSLSWTAPSPMPADFAYYRVYCDSVAPYDFADGFVAATTTLTVFVDTITTYGSYIYKVAAVDSGYTSLESSFTNTQYLVQTDTMVPVMLSLESTSHTSSATWYANALPKMQFSGQDYGTAGLKGYYYAWSRSSVLSSATIFSGGLFTAATFYHQAAALDDGPWFFHVIAADYNDNLSEPLVAALRIDTIPPAPASLTATPGERRITLEWTMPVTPYDFAGFVVYCDSTTADWSNEFVATQTYNTSFVHTGLTNNKVYRYRILAKDNRGNESQYSEVLNLYPIDETVPEISNLTATNLPVEDIWYPDNSPIYTWSATDLGDSGITGYYYTLSDTSTLTVEDVVSTGTFTAETTASYSGLDDGIWYFYVVAQDRQGNLSALARHATRIDIVPPAPANLQVVPRYRKITLVWDAPAPLPLDFDYYRVYCDSTSPYGCSQKIVC